MRRLRAASPTSTANGSSRSRSPRRRPGASTPPEPFAHRSGPAVGAARLAWRSVVCQAIPDPSAAARQSPLESHRACGGLTGAPRHATASLRSAGADLPVPADGPACRWLISNPAIVTSMRVWAAIVGVVGVVAVVLLASPGYGQISPLDSSEFVVVKSGDEPRSAVVRLSGYSAEPRAVPVMSTGTLAFSTHACAGRYDVLFRNFSRDTGEARSFAGTLRINHALLDSKEVRCPFERLRRYRPAELRLTARALEKGGGCRIIRVVGRPGTSQAGSAGRYTANVTASQNFFAAKRFRLFVVLERGKRRRTVTLEGLLRMQYPQPVAPRGVDCLPASV